MSRRRTKYGPIKNRPAPGRRVVEPGNNNRDAYPLGEAVNPKSADETHYCDPLRGETPQGAPK